MQIESTAQQDASGGITEGISLEEMLDTAGNHEQYREMAAQAHEVFDGEGFTAEVREWLASRGKPEININLTRSSVMSVIGHSEKMRTDPYVTADSADGRDVAEALNAEQNKAWRMTRAENSLLIAHIDQAVSGLGWTDVRRNRSDPTAYKYSVEYRDWQDIKCDLKSLRENGGEKMRWVGLERLMRADQARLLFRRHTRLIDNTGAGGGTGWSTMGVDNDQLNLFGSEHNRRYILLREVYERQWEMGQWITYPNGYGEEWIKGQEKHPGGVVEKRPIPKIKKNWFIGNTKIYYGDYDAPRPPFEPLLAYSRKKDSVPMGLVKDMIAPQQIYNRTVVEEQAILDSNQVLYRANAFDEDMTQDDILAEAGRVDSAFEISQNFEGRLEDAIRVTKNYQDLPHLYARMERCKEEIRDASGIQMAYSGQASSPNQSGRAINQLAEQASTNLAHIMGNRLRHRHRVAEQILHFLTQDMTEEQQVEVKGQLSNKPRTITLNYPGEDGQINNNVMMTRLSVAMGSISSSAGHRAQLQDRMETMLGQLTNNPEMLSILMPQWLKICDLPGADELLEQYTAKFGGAETPEEIAQQAAQQAQIAEETRQVEMMTQKAKAELDLANAERARAEALAKQKEAQLDPTAVDALRLQQEETKLQMLQDKQAGEQQQRAAAEEQQKMQLMQQWQEQVQQRASAA